MKKFLPHLVLWVPTLLGGMFIGIVKLNHALFAARYISSQGAIGIELVFLCLCIGVLFYQFYLLVEYLKSKIWIKAAETFISGLSFFPLFGLAIESGAAIMYAA